MTVQYMSSKGPMDIETMATPYMRNALAKLQRDGDPARAAEIEAMTAQLAEREAQEAEAPPPAGHNNPPEDEAVSAQSWPAIKAHLDDTLIEARNWADGADIVSAEQAAEVDRLLAALADGAATADEARKAEGKPHNDALTAIQAVYNPYIAPLTNKSPGSVTKAIAALKVAKTKWLCKLDDERQVEARRLRDIADAEAACAAQAMREAQKSSDLEKRDEAEAIFADAKDAERLAKTVETAKTGLRDNWVCSIADDTQAMRWAYSNYRQRLLDLALSLAQAEVRAGKRQIDGFLIKNERRA